MSIANLPMYDWPEVAAGFPASAVSCSDHHRGLDSTHRHSAARPTSFATTDGTLTQWGHYSG